VDDDLEKLRAFTDERINQLAAKLGINLNPPEAPAPPVPERGFFGDIGAEAQRGLYQSVANVSQLLGARDNALSYAIAAGKIPVDPQYQEDFKEWSRIGNEEGWLAATKFALTRPATFAQFIANVGGNIAPAAAVGAIATPFVGPLPALAITSPSYGAISTGGEMNEFFMETLGTLDPAAIEKAMQNPEYAAEVRRVALARGLIDTAGAAVSGGLAGKLLGAAGSSTASKLLAMTGEAGVQAGLGGATEYLSQKATGREDPFGIYLEMIGEVPGALIEAPFNLMMNKPSTEPLPKVPLEEDPTKPVEPEPEPAPIATGTAPIFIPGELARPGTEEERVSKYAKMNTRESLEKEAQKRNIPITGTDGKPLKKVDLARAIAVSHGVVPGIPSNFVPSPINTPKNTQIVPGSAEWKADLESLQKQIYEEAKKSNKFAPEINEDFALAYISGVNVRATRLGISPSEFHTRYGAKIKKAQERPGSFQDVFNDKNFRDWFGDSKVVDAEGKPLVVYHGTTKKGLRRFDIDKAVEVAGAAFFSTNPDVAQEYSFERAYGDILGDKPKGEVIAANIKMDNPLVWETKPGQKIVDAVEMGRAVETAKKGGYDGLIIRNIDDTVGGTGEMSDVYAVFDPKQVKSVKNTGKYNPEDSDIFNSVDADGLQSTLLAAAKGMEQSKGSGDQMLGILKNTPGVKEEEIAWTGLDEFLKGKESVTKDEIVQYLNDNQVRIEEVTLAEALPPIAMDQFLKFEPRAQDRGTGLSARYYWVVPPRLENKIEQVLIKEYSDSNSFPLVSYRVFVNGELAFNDDGVTLRQVFDKLQEYLSENYKVKFSTEYENEVAKYGTWALPGGKNYREVLLRLRNTGANFRGSHYIQPNVLAHVRLNDRTDADGKRVLFVEEIQSDWHQQGRKKGYTEGNKKGFIEFSNENPDLSGDDLAKAWSEYSDLFLKGVPDAPFKKSWHEMAFRRVVQMAAQQGYDRVAWTTGEQQAERYNLSKQVSLIDYIKNSDGTFKLGVVDKDGEGISLPKEDFTADELDDVVGKGVADKIRNNEGQSGGGRMTLRGVDLKVGGEGMKGFYDNMLVKYANKFGKKFGAKVGNTNIGAEVHSIDITPKMVESAKKGFELFNRQGPSAIRGTYSPSKKLITLFTSASKTTFLHELAHYFLDIDAALAASPNATAEMKADMDTLMKWFGVEGGTAEERLSKWNKLSIEQQRKNHERFAESFEKYLFEGKAPNKELQGLFDRFKSWVLEVYKNLEEFFAGRPYTKQGQSLADSLTDDVREVMGRMLAGPPSPFVSKLRDLSANSRISPAREVEEKLIELMTRARESSGAEREARVAEFVSALNNIGFFATIPRTKTFNEIIDFLAKSGVGSREFIEGLDPATRTEIVKDAIVQAVKSPNATEGEPAFIGKIRNVLMPKPEVAVSAPVAADPKQVEANNKIVQSALTPSENYTLERSGIFSKLPGVYDDQFPRSYGALSNLNFFWSTVPSLIRSYPFMGPLFFMFTRKAGVRRSVDAILQERLTSLVDKHGDKTLENAAYIMDAMTSPNNKMGDQPVEYYKDGRLRFVDFDGNRKLADMKTTAAFKDLQEFNKMKLEIWRKAVFGHLRTRGFDFAPNSTLMDVKIALEKEKIGGNPARVEALDSAVKVLERVESLAQDKTSYFPHTRSRGPFGITTYVRDQKTGKLEGVGFYAVKSRGFNRVDAKDLAAVRRRIREDMRSDGRQWVSLDGGSVEDARPFLINAKNLKAQVSSAKFPSAGYELLGILLTQRGVKEEDIADVVNAFDVRNNVEKLYLGFRDRANIYGYDKEGRLDSYLSSGQVAASAVANYIYNSAIRDGARKINVELGKNNAPEAVQRHVQNYIDTNLSFGEDAARLRSLAYYWFMFGNLSSAVLQLVSPLLITVPSMSEFATPTQILKWTAAAPLQLPLQLIRSRMFWNGRPVPEDAAKLRQLAGTFGVSEEEARMHIDLLARGAFSESPAVDAITEKSVVKKGFGSVVERINSIIPVCEQTARVQSAHMLFDVLSNSASYQRAVAALSKDEFFNTFVKAEYGGVPSKQAIVHFKLLENHGVYGKEARSRMLDTPAGILSLPLTNYVSQMMEMLGRMMVGRDGKGATAGTGLVLASLALTAWVYGGIKALPGEQPLDWFVKFYQKYFNGRKADAQFVLSELLNSSGFSPEAIRLIQAGPVTALTDGFLFIPGGRIGINSPVFNLASQLIDSVLDPQSNASPADLMGAPGSIVKGAVQAASQINEGGNLISSLGTAFAPSAIKNLFKAEDLASGEFRTGAGQVLLPPMGAEGGPRISDIVNQVVGFTPEIVNSARQARYQRNQYLTSYSGTGAKYYKRAAQARYSYSKGNLSKEEAAKIIAENIKSYMEVSKKAGRKYAEARSGWKEGFKKEYFKLSDTNYVDKGGPDDPTLADINQFIGGNPRAN